MQNIPPENQDTVAPPRHTPTHPKRDRSPHPADDSYAHHNVLRVRSVQRCSQIPPRNRLEAVTHTVLPDGPTVLGHPQTKTYLRGPRFGQPLRGVYTGLAGRINHPANG